MRYTHRVMHDLPVMLKVRGRRCVVVGGGGVAARRARALRDAGAQVVVIAPQIAPELASLGVTYLQRAYRPGDLAGAWLAVAATDDPAVNQQVAREAAQSGVLINRADDPEAGDWTVPAHAHHGPVTLAVHTGGVSASAAAAIRRQLSAALDPDWPALLAAVAAYRDRIQRRFADPQDRQQRLRKLTDEQAMNILKSQGVDALRRYCESLAAGPDDPPAAGDPPPLDTP